MKILIVDDHPLVREAMALLITRLDREVRVLEASDCATGLEAARSNRDLDLVLLDLHLPGLRGMDALDRFRNEHPSTPVVVVSMYRDRDIVDEAIAHGAMGFIPKSTSRESIVNALRLVLSGGIYVPPDVGGGGTSAEPATVHVSQGAPTAAGLGITPRQGQVLALVMRGCTNKTICNELGLAERTVKAHLTAVLNALKVSNRTQAVIAAGRLGVDLNALLDPNDGDVG